MSKKLYVGNIAFSTTEESIRALFGQYGEVLSVKIPTDQMSGRPRGFCFVEMENADEAIKALNETTHEGRQIKVNVAMERQPRDRDEGRSRGGFGGKGGRDRW